jgi:hypothetical protein
MTHESSSYVRQECENKKKMIENGNAGEANGESRDVFSLIIAASS